MLFQFGTLVYHFHLVCISLRNNICGTTKFEHGFFFRILENVFSLWFRLNCCSTVPTQPPNVLCLDAPSSSFSIGFLFTLMKIPRDLIDGGIAIWRWIIHFCSNQQCCFCLEWPVINF
uniref:Uncharacterized protein n=1 Tax=Triticum urartu TaxID=4572 RepID=A0A8R7PSN4_TRIUA